MKLQIVAQASLLLKNGVDLASRFLMQRNARHARIDTTGLYLHAEEKEWHETMERHRLKD